ncbi:phospho-N-acetylmuramoyl-pentapeptide-transferase [Sporichthya sp.]|uniref:phospho-N-acetylmuramoyl-pentapeptide- transferase n=1 Tax=Sporichthya sp. TaxID=65475 RepID=UPI0018438467|nr:phospho-N-acetylmuramoyl-pentapeptide-transferase [Sporichthya sp.]MBA3743140.1 phospho-N-acetylmuramoyl-pentapeptide-transferase [Sporichthya sp.]
MRGVLAAAAVALIISLLGTPIAIRILVRQGYGQLIRDDGPTTHQTKRGTPTMGGSVIIIAVLAGYLAAHLVLRDKSPTAPALQVLFLMAGLGLVGFLDDYIKVSKQRSLGLRSKAKLAGQSVVALAFALMALNFEDYRGFSPASKEISFIRDTGFQLGAVGFVIFAYVMIAATSNGVNLTDGLDGLATGAAGMVCAAYVLIGVWQAGNTCVPNPVVPQPQCYDTPNALDLAIVAAAVMGACFGFLWWNAAPAKIFMGDTGSLALGGVIAGLAITTRTELLLVLLGGLFVLITISVIVQVGFFKLTRRRVFRMAPLQHHFELVGWHEVTIVIRFWIIAGLFVAAGLGVFYAEWVSAA